DERGGFDVRKFRQAVDVTITAQEIIVDNASYPTPKIAANSRDYRPLGLGYANLGALLMYNGLAYDSDTGRDFAAAITAVMTGVEPDLALVKFKKLVGGGMIKIVNHTVRPALSKLGYSESEGSAILKFIDENGTIEGAPFVKIEHLPVFDCAFKPQRGTRSIHYMGHIKMMSAVQPFISG